MERRTLKARTSHIETDTLTHSHRYTLTHKHTHAHGIPVPLQGIPLIARTASQSGEFITTPQKSLVTSVAQTARAAHTENTLSLRA